MPGSFPEDLPPKLPPVLHQQGVKRQRDERSQEDGRAAIEAAPPVFKKQRHTNDGTQVIDNDIPDPEEVSPKQQGRVSVGPVSSEEALRQKYRRASLGLISSIRSPELSAEGAGSLKHDYEALRKLGESSEGQVWLKKSKKTSELLAVKVLKRKAQSDHVGDLPIEVLLHLNLRSHPHIAFLTQVDIVDRQIHLGMSWENGGDLIDYLKRRDRLGFSGDGHKVFVIHLAIQLAEALAFLHHGLRRNTKGQWETESGWKRDSHALIFGDLKPDNCVIHFSPANDYGILPCLRLCDTGHMTLASSPLRVAGSPLYFCPEVAAADAGLKGHPMSTASDVWTFGATIYFMITGRHWKSSADPRFMRLPADYDELGFTRFLQMCLQANPKCRPTMDCHLGHGILHSIIAQACDLRDDLMYQSKTCDRDFWVDWRKAAVKA